MTGIDLSSNQINLAMERANNEKNEQVVTSTWDAGRYTRRESMPKSISVSF